MNNELALNNPRITRIHCTVFTLCSDTQCTVSTLCSDTHCTVFTLCSDTQCTVFTLCSDTQCTVFTLCSDTQCTVFTLCSDTHCTVFTLCSDTQCTFLRVCIEGDSTGLSCKSCLDDYLKGQIKSTCLLGVPLHNTIMWHEPCSEHEIILKHISFELEAICRPFF
jgi:hypothetical protein